MTDQLFHRYEYDADNRITDVYISDHKQLIGIPVLEEHDARYEYYRHGILARAVLGQQEVQGIDYTYTLQGWIKAVNQDSLLDIDGKVGRATAKDAYRYSLNYFNAEYLPIGSAVQSVFSGHTGFMDTDIEDYRPMYNGVISSMVVGIPQLGETKLYNYGYDQLNRLVKMETWRGYNTITGQWDANLQKTQDYRERISYDANGNIKTYDRHGVGSQFNMDSLVYVYNLDANGHLANNRLRHVNDRVISIYPDDIENQIDDNYEYDAIGNLIKDSTEGIKAITWNVYGKIKSVTKHDGTIIVYSYDMLGNRICREVAKTGSSISTWYTRDAKGNIMAIYTEKDNNLMLNEQVIFGSGRLGAWNREINMDGAVNRNNSNFIRGRKLFELSNHLGNVLVTITDRKISYCPDPDESVYCGDNHLGQPQLCNCSQSLYSSYYKADIASANDYYPFGMRMPARNYSTNIKYRFGFNGKENDNMISGEGNNLDFGARVYDSRIARWLSLDPYQKKYPYESNYAFVSNNPIYYRDGDGRDRFVTITILRDDGKHIQIQARFPGEFKYYAEECMGARDFAKYDIKEHFIFDNRAGARKISHTEDLGQRYNITGWEWSIFSDININFDPTGDNSDEIGYGYRIYAEGSDMAWQKGLPTAGEGTESIDIKGLLQMAGNWREFGAKIEPAEMIEGWEKTSELLEMADNISDAINAINDACDGCLEREKPVTKPNPLAIKDIQIKPLPVRDTQYASENGVVRDPKGNAYIYSTSSQTTIPSNDRSTPDTIRTIKYEKPKN